jgi:hypothetical protein
MRTSDGRVKRRLCTLPLRREAEEGCEAFVCCSFCLGGAGAPLALRQKHAHSAVHPLLKIEQILYE